MILQDILKHYSIDPNSGVLNDTHISQNGIWLLHVLTCTYRYITDIHLCSGETTLGDIIMTLL